MESSPEQSHTDLATLIKSGIDREGLTQKAVAQAAGVHPSHLSQVLSGKKRFSKKKLMDVADVLNISKTEILEASSYSDKEVNHAADVDPRSFMLLSKKNEVELKVVTDPRFIDSALFLWTLDRQPFKSVGIKCTPKLFDWSLVPEKVISTNGVGFFNRRSETRMSGRKRWNVSVWSDLSLYKGYSLLARSEDVERIKNGDVEIRPGDNIMESYEDSNKYLELLVNSYDDKDKPTIVCIGSDTRARAKNPLNFINEEDFDFQEIADSDTALEYFHDGGGDLFIGGLPQRLAAMETGDYVEVINFDNNPLMISLNSLVYSGVFYEKEYSESVLSALSSLWYSTISRIKRDPSFRSRVIDDITDMITRYGYDDHHLKKEFLEKVLPVGEDREGTSKYEFFPSKPNEITDFLMENSITIMRLFENERDLGISDISEHINEILNIDRNSYSR